MTQHRKSRPFLRGITDGLPFLLVIIPFGGLFGVVSSEAGLDLWATMGFSVIVLAGASQFSAVSLLEDQAPVILAILTSLAINLRMAMYSASLTPYVGKAPLWKRALVAYLMIDQTYVASHSRFEERTDWGLRQRLSYYWGLALPLMSVWSAATLLGALLGNKIPAEIPIDFAIPITFLAMIGPMLRTPAHLLTAISSIVLGLVFSGIPNGLGVILAGLISMAIGAECERRMETG